MIIIFLCRDSKRTVELGKQIRDITTYTLRRLRDDIPKAYQEVSTAHPYLPFFHRVESILQGLSWFDPEDDDVICLDDDEVEVEKQKQKNNPKINIKSNNGSHKTVQIVDTEDGHQQDDESQNKHQPSLNGQHTPILADGNNTVSKVAVNEDNKWICSTCTYVNEQNESLCVICDTQNPYASDIKPNSLCDAAMTEEQREEMLRQRAPQISETLVNQIRCLDFGDRSSSSCYWDRSWSVIIDLLCKIFQKSNSCWMLEFDERELSIVKNSICFSDIVEALATPQGNGQLVRTKLSWSMYKMNDLLQAIDLVFLNKLAMNGPKRTRMRNDVMTVRKYFWNALEKHASKSPTKVTLPTKRSERSGFVIKK